MNGIDHIAGRTFHGRRGPVGNRFSYGVDYVLFDAEKPLRLPRLMVRNRAGLVSLRDRDHGGIPGQGTGAAWVRQVLDAQGLAGATDGAVLLLTQPRILGHLFNPVSFWLCHDSAGGLRAVIAEVSNTYGDRHSYLCVKPDQSVITAQDDLRAQKVFHVSPFQPVAGRYAFRFDITPEKVSIRIAYSQTDEAPGAGLVATLAGPRAGLTNRRLLGAMLRRPFGSRRVLALIHWQALKLWWRGAPFRPRPEPPAQEVSQ
ncbi:DUF1365 domain-containing protein [Roseinatronobacter alkalisoli]|uniref:DUF1365 domain-containing protein n=1 Tax=Roseinatronobacter alkalisoli TaxID=3028235 RepID=A0ABT5T8S8_9RHOB|nr:DUF1365 domain-containing protein [Roseinatronobacter sp. HJB301]MDD7971391.1 DUF1365 domain-containing protein [Roseinatronobacter sp. HJB301]